MINRNDSGVVEDIWINTRAGSDEDDDRTGPNDTEDPSGWDEVEEANVLLNPDVAGMDRG